MIGIAVELFTNLFQSVMFIGFLYLFFDKPEGRLRRLLPFLGGVLAFSCVLDFFVFYGLLSSASTYYLDSLMCITILELYSILFLRGKVYLRILMPIVAFGINAVISYTFGYLASFISGIPVEESLVMSTGFRYFCIVVINLTTALLFWFVARIGSKRIRLSGVAEITAFLIIPLLCLVILYCNFFAYQVSEFNSSILPYLLVICFVMVVIAILTCIMLVRISKANAIKTELLLTSQREKLYEESTLASNKQIEKISSIKHDMKNKLWTLEKLISDGDFDEATQLCRDTSRRLETTYTPINTSNAVLNAIVNVELEKASSLDIDFNLEISDILSEMSSADTVSLIGNLCDNAIEYLLAQPKEQREMHLQIRSHLNYHIITCRNKITASVLQNNPELLTSKDDKNSHGKGVSILKRIAQDYDGEVKFDEENGWFIVGVVIGCKV